MFTICCTNNSRFYHLSADVTKSDGNSKLFNHKLDVSLKGKHFKRTNCILNSTNIITVKETNNNSSVFPCQCSRIIDMIMLFLVRLHQNTLKESQRASYQDNNLVQHARTASSDLTKSICTRLALILPGFVHPRELFQW